MPNLKTTIEKVKYLDAGKTCCKNCGLSGMHNVPHKCERVCLSCGRMLDEEARLWQKMYPEEVNNRRE